MIADQSRPAVRCYSGREQNELFPAPPIKRQPSGERLADTLRKLGSIGFDQRRLAGDRDFRNGCSNGHWNVDRESLSYLKDKLLAHKSLEAIFADCDFVVSGLQ